MCGISGYFGNKKLNTEAITNCLHALEKRGPDFSNYKCLSYSNKEVCLIHSRLSIIDLDSRSNQPFSIEHATIAFNGEIYNYLELSKKLVADGVVLKTKSDTEVLL